jgi:F420-dependent oxidoreductase-like protein
MTPTAASSSSTVLVTGFVLRPCRGRPRLADPHTPYPLESLDFAPMDLRIMIEPQQGASYEQQLAVAHAAEDGGFSGFFRSDHYLRIGGGDGSPGPTDTWITLGAIARETSRIRLGTMVSSATFRLPGPLAVAVAQVDQMSGGRVELGIGAGWYDDEHTAYGIPFPTLRERFERLEEQLAIVTGLWRTPPEGQFSFEGDHYTLVASPALPKPFQPGGPPIIIGGNGPKRTPRLAATYAAEFNVAFRAADVFATKVERVRAACEAVERDPDDIVCSVALTVCCGESAEEVGLRAGRIGQSVDNLRASGAVGSPAEIVDRIADYVEAGATRIYFQVLDLDDLDQIALLAERVLPVLP